MLRAKIPIRPPVEPSRPARSRQARPGEDSRHDSKGRGISSDYENGVAYRTVRTASWDHRVFCEFLHFGLAVLQASVSDFGSLNCAGHWSEAGVGVVFDGKFVGQVFQQRS